MKITKTRKGKYTTVVRLDESRTKRITADTRQELTALVADALSSARIATESKQFGDALNRYIDARKPYKSVSTLRAYKSIGRTLESKYGAFNALSVDRITDADGQKLVYQMQRDGYSTKTLKNVTGLINSVLIECKRPPLKLMLPREPVPDRPVYSEGEVRMLLCLLHGHPLEVPFQLAILGLRRGEICALTLSDLSQDDVLHVHRSAVLEDGGGVVVNEIPKNTTSDRYVALSPDLAALIRKQGYITKCNPNSLTDMYRTFLARYKFPPYRLHDCRHFFASYCHAKGIPEADILSAGGWKTPNIMRSVYRHSMAQSSASDAIKSLFAAR
jgi:integrase